jgi:hypothetical protein
METFAAELVQVVTRCTVKTCLEDRWPAFHFDALASNARVDLKVRLSRVS